MNKSDSYADMKVWLVQNYGGVSRIINDIIGDLAWRTKPNFSNNNAKFTFMSYQQCSSSDRETFQGRGN